MTELWLLIHNSHSGGLRLLCISAHRVVSCLQPCEVKCDTTRNATVHDMSQAACEILLLF